MGPVYLCIETYILYLDLKSDSSRISTIMSDVEGDDVPMAAAPDAGSMDINTAIQEVLKAALINTVWPVVFMKPPSLWIKDKHCFAFLQKTVTKKNTRSSYRLSVKNIRFP